MKVAADEKSQESSGEIHDDSNSKGAPGEGELSKIIHFFSLQIKG
jgi:hypothetical protein